MVGPRSFESALKITTIKLGILVPTYKLNFGEVYKKEETFLNFLAKKNKRREGTPSIEYYYYKKYSYDDVVVGYVVEIAGKQ